MGTDDPVREQLRQLARAGQDADVKRIARTPVSPVPPTHGTRARPTPPTRSAPVRPVAPKRAGLTWALAATAVVAVAAVGALVMRGSGSTTSVTTAAPPVTPPPPPPPETVRVEVPVPVPTPVVATADSTTAPVRRRRPPRRPVADRVQSFSAPDAASGATERVEIEAAIAAFAEAFRSRDLSRVRRVYPGMTPQQAQEWGTFFMDARNLEARLAVTSFDPLPDRIIAQVSGALDWESLRTGRAESRAVAYRAVYTRTGRGWVLTSLR
jgi:hypothetical protein